MKSKEGQDGPKERKSVSTFKGASRYKVWCGVVWCGVVWCGVVRCGVVRCGVVVVWCGVVWCGVVWWLIFKVLVYSK